MTFDEVVAALGLLPFDEYERSPKRLAWIKEMQKHHPEENISFRARGTTTKMLCYMLVHLSNDPDGNKVYVEGHSPMYSRQLCHQARDYAAQLGLNPMDIQPFYRETTFADKRGVNVFSDHYHSLGI